MGYGRLEESEPGAGYEGEGIRRARFGWDGKRCSRGAKVTRVGMSRIVRGSPFGITVDMKPAETHRRDEEEEHGDDPPTCSARDRASRIRRDHE